MKKIILKFVLLTSLLVSSLAISVPIKNIEILGLDVISRGTVLSYLPVEVGDDYTEKTSKEIISSLYKTQFFKDIEVSEVNQTLKITVIENPHIKYIDLLNHSDKVIDDDALKQVLSSMDLTPGKIFNKRQLDKLIEQLKATYISKGYYGIKITKEVEIDSSNRVGIELDISEGEVARIKSMHISGNKVQEEKTLLNLFQIGEPDFFIVNYFTEKDHYSKVALDAGLETLKSYYFNLGYLDFKVTDVKSDLSKDKQSIDIAIQVDEGSKYKVGKIEFTGNMLNESSESLSKLLTLSTGNIFERKKIIDSLKAITDLYTNQGYAFAKIDALTSEGEVANIINLKFKVSPHKKVYINRITITGNTRTQDEVVRREINIYEGGLYSNEELEESINKLKRLGFFSDVKMEVSKLKNFDDKINLNFSVEETKTGTFSVGLSNSNSTGSSFNVGIEEKNFLGTGNTLNAKTAQSKAVKELQVYFSNPYFTKDKHSISYGIFAKKTEGAELKVEEYKVNEKGGSVGYGIPITKDTRIGVNLKFSSRDITCGENFAKAGYEKVQCSSNDKTEAKLSVNWSNNTLDDYNFPTKGNSNHLKMSVALPVADFRYYKLDASHRSYYPFTKNLTLKTSAEIGLAKGYGDKELPFFERYYGGGSSSVRGFSFNSLGVKYPNGKAKGGELSMSMNASIISPVTFMEDSKNMRVSAFIDAGGISEKIAFSTNDFRASIGLGFIWLTPVGPLGVYAAKPLIKKAGDKTNTFEFTIGANF
jgi:outer membrane protein insertion porin family